MRHSILTLFLSLFTLGYGTLSAQKVEIKCAYKHLLEGERGLLHIVSENADVENLTRTIQGNGFSMQFIKNEVLRSNTVTQYIYSYRIIPKRTGEFRTPPIKVNIGNKPTTIDPVTFFVHTKDKFSVEVFTIGGKKIEYFTGVFTEKDTISVNEIQNVEVRYLIPEKINLQQWGSLDKALSSSVISLNFNPPLYLGAFYKYQLSTSYSDINGITYRGVAYKSIIYSESAGSIELGPFSTNSIFSESSSMGTSGFSFSQSVQKKLTTPKKSLKVNTLPLPKPQRFTGNVGDFSMLVEESSQTNITKNESYKISVTISGKGNFLAIDPPTLLDNEKWEIIDFSTSELSNEAHFYENMIQYDFLVSPVQPVNRSPQLEFQFFNPNTQQYQTEKNETTPLNFINKTVNNSNSQSIVLADTSINQLDILGVIPINKHSDISLFWLKYWHIIPLSLLILIIALALFKWWEQRKHTTSKRQLVRSDLEKIKQSSCSATFYKSVSLFIEKWCTSSEEPEIEQIKKQANALAFMPKSNSSVEPGISLEKKAKIIKVLKRCCIVLIIMGFCGQQAKADEEQIAITHYEKQEYTEAIETYKNIPSSPDSLYNIGVCYYKTGDIGKAALYFHKARLKNPDHKESAQNLKFIAKSFNHSSHVTLTKQEKVISYFPYSTYLLILQISGWILVLTILAQFSLKINHRVKGVFTLGYILFSTLTILAFIALQLYPKSIYFSNISTLAVLQNEKVFLRTEPYTPAKEEASNSITELPLASLCKPIAIRSTWTYIELENNTRGWIPSNNILSIQDTPTE